MIESNNKTWLSDVSNLTILYQAVLCKYLTSKSCLIKKLQTLNKRYININTNYNETKEYT